MKVRLIDWTGKGMSDRYAAELMAFTKQTRLKMDSELQWDIASWDDDQLEEELEYMANTIPSSWEFCHYTFLLTGCTRAFTHQLVRNRQGSYAQQTMRILDVTGFNYEDGPTTADSDLYHSTMEYLNKTYSTLIADGAAIEDARGILPTNIHTNIVCSYNLRTMAEIISKRSSPRTQGEYRQFVNGARNEILKVHPWAKVFLRNRKQDSAAALDKMIEENFSGDEKIALLKHVDILRG